nr:pectinesterase family protein [uncultured Acetatifactor sp.]
MRLTVGKGGQFGKIGEALQYAQDCGEEERIIHIFPGKYYEKLEIRQEGLILEGESAEDTIITYDDYANALMPDGEKRGTFRSYTMLVDAPRVRLENLTVENSAGPQKIVGQAIALYAEGEGIVVKNCRLLGAQDTLFTGPLPPKEVMPGGFRGPKEFAPRIDGRQYYENCYICGTVDFIFGSATAYFENCTLESLPREEGYVTAGSSPEGQKYGYVFSHCRFVGEGPENSIYLGRPWRDHAKTVILNSYLGAHIRREGWHDWGKEQAHETAYYAEYHNEGPGAEGERVPWAHILTDEEVKEYTKEKVLAGLKVL